MILSFKNKATEDIFNGKNSKEARKLCPQSLWKVAFRKLDPLDSVISLEELKIPPGNRLESLSGDRKEHKHSYQRPIADLFSLARFLSLPS